MAARGRPPADRRGAGSGGRAGTGKAAARTRSAARSAPTRSAPQRSSRSTARSGSASSARSATSSRAASSRASSSRAASSRASSSRSAARATTRRATPRTKRRLRLGRTGIIGLLVVLLLAAGGWVVYFSSAFGVRDIRIEGTALVESSQVEQVIGLGPDDALASVDLDAVATTIEQQLPPVQSAQVRRSWPGTLVVTITERTPVATVKVDGAPWLIDATGTPYLAVSDYPEKLPNLLPLEVEEPSPDSLATREAVAVIDGLTDDVRELVASVSAPSAGQVTLQLADGRVVIWGDSSRMKDKLTMLPGVLEHSGSQFDISSPQAIVIK